MTPLLCPLPAAAPRFLHCPLHGWMDRRTETFCQESGHQFLHQLLCTLHRTTDGCKQIRGPKQGAPKWTATAGSPVGPCLTPALGVLRWVPTLSLGRWMLCWRSGAKLGPAPTLLAAPWPPHCLMESLLCSQLPHLGPLLHVRCLPGTLWAQSLPTLGTASPTAASAPGAPSHLGAEPSKAPVTVGARGREGAAGCLCEQGGATNSSSLGVCAALG